jgi:cobalt-zinc-cadmium efflux system protein
VNAFLGSLAVIVAAVFISVWQIYVADAWAGIVFAVILIWAAYGIIRDSFFILVDATPRDIDLVSVEAELSTIPGVIGVHHLHARVVSGDIKTFSGHVVVDDLGKAAEVLRRAKNLLDEKYQFTLSTVQIEDAALSEADSHQLEYRRVTRDDS